MTRSLDERAELVSAGNGGCVDGETEYRAVLPATAQAVPAVRAYMRAVAGGWRRAVELELVASELASCAVRARASEVFTVTAHPRAGRMRVEVAMSGSGWWPSGDGEDAMAYGCALAIVAGLADRFGHEGSSGAAVLWAEVTLPVGDR